MLKIFTVFAVTAVSAGLVSALAQSDPMKTRKDIMKGVGDATKGAVAMLRGKAPFELAKATETFEIYENAGKRMPDLFPDTSKPSPETAASLKSGESVASLKIWDEKPKFLAGFAKLEKEAHSAREQVKDLASFREAFTSVTKNCDNCHENYRIKKD